jgi:hypothetical protein
MRLRPRAYRSACAFAIGTTLSFPMMAASDEIRVLFVPSQDLATEVRARALEEAIAARSHSLRIVKDLADTDVLVQFTEYRIEHRKKNGPLRWWDGRVKLLLRADAGPKEAARAFRLPERFALAIMGEAGGTEMDRTAAALENFLRKAVGRERQRRGAEAI